MSKRLISLVLCVLMLASIFMTSCAKEEIVLDTSASALTLTMMAITDTQVYYTDEEYEALSEEEKAHVAEVKAQYDAVEEAINKITKEKFKMIRNSGSEEELIEAVEKMMAAGGYENLAD